MNLSLAEALGHVDLQPGQIYRETVNGHTVEVRVLADASTPKTAEAGPDQTHFVLSPERWDAFCALLDRPPKELPALQKLLTQPSVLDDNRRSS